VVGDSFTWTRDNVNGKRRAPKGDDAGRDLREDAAHDAAHGAEIECIDDEEENAAADADAETLEDAPKVAHAPSKALSPAMTALLEELLPHLDGRIKGASLDRAAVESIVRDMTPKVARVEVKRLDGAIHDAGVQHRDFARLLLAVASGTNVLVVGPAGAGKSYAIQAIAKALGKTYYETGAVSSAHEILGYMNAQGTYVPSLCRKAWEFGGLFNWEEVDASDANATVAFQAMLAGATIAPFPDGMVKRHPDCQFIATGNTMGLGGTYEFVGRNKLDGAFLDRWSNFPWTLDEDLERATCANAAWVARVQQVRARVIAKGLRHMVTPRATYTGEKLLAAGLDQPTVETMTLRKALTDDQWTQVSK
jgi:cobaltochelatase CobS